MTTQNNQLEAVEEGNTIPSLLGEESEYSAIPQINSLYQQEEKVVRLTDGRTFLKRDESNLIEYNDQKFQMFSDGWWQVGHTGADEKGLYQQFYRCKGEFVGYT